MAFVRSWVMVQSEHTRGCWSLVVLASGLGAALIGCGGGMDFGPSVRIPPKQRQVLTEAAKGTVFEYPSGQAFNIHIKKSDQNPGANGRAEGDADATPEGSAMCSAEGTNGGSASGEFHLGQAIDYDGTVPVRVVATVSFDLTHELLAEPIAADTLADLSMSIFVRDTTGRVHPKIVLETLTSDDAPGQGKRSDVRDFAFTMEPDREYQVIIQGAVHAKTDNPQLLDADAGVETTKASARLELSNVKLTLTFEQSPMPASAGEAAE
jgi:hypothetical protein